ncbi:hypothetical protein ACH42_05065 [Endozoicomonas sp. (ex Bugula neritina AB1)]|nr:hypothetical protein ACH42_05065 [Endozoicomonas sp. (ex Bugula neritina AB1)]
MDYLETLDALHKLMEKPEHHDSPIGVLSRMHIKHFIKVHGFDAVDERLMVQLTSERIFNLVAKKAEKLEDKLIRETEDEKVKRKIQYSRNERKLEAKYRKELLEKS